MARLASRALRIQLAVAWLVASPTFAGTKFDLSPYVANLSMEGDHRVFERSTGGRRTVTVLEVVPWTKGWKEILESETTGTDDDGTSVSENYLMPGKQLLSGDEFYDSGLSFRVAKPIKSLGLWVTPDKVQRISQKARAFFDDRYAGKVELRGAWWIDDFETIETPSGTYENALRARDSSRTRLRVVKGALGCSHGVCGSELAVETHRTSWYAAGRGLVRADVDVTSFVDGQPVDEDSWSEVLSSGSSDGVPFP